MNEEEKETKNSNEIVDIVENILDFNRQQEGQSMLKNFKTMPDTQQIANCFSSIEIRK